MYRNFIKPFLFLFPPETAHHLVTVYLKMVCYIPFLNFLIRKLYCINKEKLCRNVFGIKFPNPVGLAAGFDKNAKFFNELADFGFGFIEIGTVTPVAQGGNPKPRLFRLSKDEALINRMGFNNDGVENVVERLKKRNPKIIIGGNIGKSKTTANEKSIEDYEKCFCALCNYVDYIAVNVSSPNTPHLRELQEKEYLKKILLRLKEINLKPKPLLLKIAPDLTNRQLDDIIEVAHETKIDGIIATNTTISRENLQTTKDYGNGGLSGKPLAKRSTEVIKYICGKSKIPVIGVGGIHSPEDALEKLNAGASLIQIYTGFIYEGPSLVKKINKAILKKNNNL